MKTAQSSGELNLRVKNKIKIDLAHPSLPPSFSPGSFCPRHGDSEICVSDTAFLFPSWFPPSSDFSFPFLL